MSSRSALSTVGPPPPRPLPYPITVRGRDLVHDLMGRHSFTDMIYFLLRGRMPTASQTRVLDACLVTLMEHGWTPTSIIARLAIDSVPGQAQVGIAAGLLAVGDVFVGTMEGAGRILAALCQLSSRITLRGHDDREALVMALARHQLHRRLKHERTAN
jgi:citrate synthase